MTPAILVLNAGSSSLKYRLIEPDTTETRCSGLVQRIGEAGSRVRHTWGETTTEQDVHVPDHREAMRRVLASFDDLGPRLAEAHIVAVGHRVVMGGSEFSGPAHITDAVVAAIERLAPLAPLHNPPSIATIEVAGELLPDVPHVAVFDTAFFHDLPDVARTYALDRELAARHAVRRYGFHGTSHQYVSRCAGELLGGDPTGLRQIVLHLGNGASASAIVGGRPVATSMGMTPLEGLVMGTRSGDIDPGIVIHLCRVAGLRIDDVDHVLNHRSGLLGLAGVNDMRDVHRLVAQRDADAVLALAIYVDRLKRYIGAYAAVMGGLDAITFTAGVGENDPIVRAMTTDGLEFLGIQLDPGRNDAPSSAARLISSDESSVSVLVVPTNEELEIAREVRALVPTPQG